MFCAAIDAGFMSHLLTISFIYRVQFLGVLIYLIFDDAE